MTAKIKLNAASGGGSFSLQAPSSSANNRVMTLPDTADGTVLTTTNPKAGNIIQVLQAVKTDTFLLDGTNTADITGLSIAITPSSSSNKILVSYNVSAAAEAGGYSGLLFLFRDSTQIYLGDASSNRTRASSFILSHSAVDFGSQEMFDLSGTFLDSPSTTSATTYKLSVKSQNSGKAFYVNRHNNDGDGSGSPRTASSITVMEVAG
tara:strand:- start:240 stop:860 length:621 start_codon:yes stop_codon:yes gene_type:complete